jgi:hypothetical protein
MLAEKQPNTTKTLNENASLVIYSIPKVAATKVKNNTSNTLINDNISMCIVQFIVISSLITILYKAHVVQMCNLNIKYKAKTHIDAKQQILNSNR